MFFSFLCENDWAHGCVGYAVRKIAHAKNHRDGLSLRKIVLQKR